MRTSPPLWLDYQRPPPGRQRLGQVLLIVGVMLAVPMFAEYFSTAAELTAVDQRLATLRKKTERRLLFERTAPLAAANSDSAKPAPPSAARWESLLGSLERASDDSVTLLALMPGAKEISLVGEAGSLAASLDYVTRLQTASVLSDAHLTGYQVLAAHPRHPVRFTLVAAWPETPR
jgi:hypothetical protein